MSSADNPELSKAIETFRLKPDRKNGAGLLAALKQSVVLLPYREPNEPGGNREYCVDELKEGQRGIEIYSGTAPLWKNYPEPHFETLLWANFLHLLRQHDLWQLLILDPYKESGIIIQRHAALGGEAGGQGVQLLKVTDESAAPPAELQIESLKPLDSCPEAPNCRNDLGYAHETWAGTWWHLKRRIVGGLILAAILIPLFLLWEHFFAKK